MASERQTLSSPEFDFWLDTCLLGLLGSLDTCLLGPFDTCLLGLVGSLDTCLLGLVGPFDVCLVGLVGSFETCLLGPFDTCLVGLFPWRVDFTTNAGSESVFLGVVTG